jgi:exo-beta-1,3-glucanase (GH17 family)/cellulose synthase/poly-beta-1,6-N-acetylglucosamine synthase-like glycosyltransferase
MKWKWSGFLVAAVFAALTVGLWAYFNRPTDEPPWPDRVQGMAFSPFYSGQNPVYQVMPTEAQIETDLALLADKATAVRTYSSLKTLNLVPAIAAKHQIKVAVGAWVDRDLRTNELEIQAAIDLANAHDNVIRVIIGNEAVLRGDLTVANLARELDRARAAVAQPVSTAEPWHVWLSNPELAEHVDFITVHLLPYWEGVHVEQAIDYLALRMEQLEDRFPDKRIVIGEVGWPSDGRTRGSAVASTSNEALFLRRFLKRARDKGYVYYIMEAFDQPWKAQYEGAVGAYWGVYDVDRRPKFEFIAPIVRIPEWQMLAGVSVVIAGLVLGLFYVHSRALGTRGRSLLALVTYAAATAAVWVIYDYSQKYLTFASILIGALLIVGMLGVIALLLAEALEWAEAHWSKTRPRALPTAGKSAPALKASIHVPMYNEPPQMVIETLDALGRLDYPDFEVLVIDNNTQDESVWRPVEKHCRALGARFRFFHVAPLAGFKAGALNYVLSKTSPDAEIVAVIDSDYKVDPHWLRDLSPAFGDPKVAIVQAPQDYRDEQDNLFKAMCYAEYRGFFHIGMVTRNERNAIIQHGTMTLVRRDALERADGWAEWSITEDAELGLRLFEHGYDAYYQPRSYGRGLMPETFHDYKKQRFRWAYGAIQILRAHANALLSRRDARLTLGQRYHFIAGWLPWLGDGVNLLFNIAAISWSAAMIVAPHRFDPPLVMFSLLPLALFTFKLVKLAHLYVSRIGANIRQTFAAAIAGLALSHTIGAAVVKGMITRNEPFFRTPKVKQPHFLLEGVAAARQETLLFALLTLAAVGLTRQLQISPDRLIGVPEELRGPDVSMWVAVLLIQSIPYAAALLVSLVSALPLPARWLGPPSTAPSPHPSVIPSQH